MKKEVERNMRLLQLLSQSFPTEAAAGTEFINLEAILNLPKPTEHFVADIHGEYEAFLPILRNASGNIRRKVIELFGSQMRDKEIRELCTLIYYPEQKLEQHEPFESISEAVKNETDIKSSTQIVQLTGDRIMVRDTDKGEEVQKQIKELKELLYAYRHGYINEKKV